MEAIVIFVSN